MRSIAAETEFWVDLDRDFKAERVREMSKILQLIRHLATILRKFLSLVDE